MSRFDVKMSLVVNWTMRRKRILLRSSKKNFGTDITHLVGRDTRNKNQESMRIFYNIMAIFISFFGGFSTSGFPIPT